MITKTDAVVLKSMKFRGTSKIVTFYTRRYGKLKGVAKGARETKSKFGAALEPMTLVGLVLYKKEHRDLQLISQSDIIRPYKKIHSEIERMSVALSVLELVNQLSHEEEENILLYTLLIETLDEIERASKNYLSLFYAFELRLSALFGFAPALKMCRACGRKLENFTNPEVVLQLSKGGILCPRCGEEVVAHPYEKFFTQPSGRTRIEGENLSISLQTLRILDRLLLAKLESISGLDYNKAIGNEVDATLRLYLRYHFEDLKPLKSLEILQKIVN